MGRGDRQKLREALDHWKKVEEQARDGGISFIEGMRLLAGAPIGLADDGDADAERQWSFVHAGPWLGRVLADLRSPENLTQIELGDALRGTLRPYQESGLAWLWLLSNLRLGACLADDMGLGKTIQVLALLSALKKRGAARASLLVVPASLLANWRAEMARLISRPWTKPACGDCTFHPGNRFGRREERRTKL